MIRINLLPIRQIKQRIQTKNEVLAFACLLCIFLIALGLVGYSQTRKIEGLKKTQAQLIQEKKKYESVIARIEKIKREKALLETKLEVIKNLKADSQLPVRVLDEIAKITPSSRMWLKSMSLTQGGVSLTGIALDNATIAQYMDSLSSAPYFSGTELKNSSLTVVAGQKLKSFALTMAVKKPAVEQPKSE
nr:PilN domain-containing protein [Desulfobulbaceae bacterium]